MEDKMDPADAPTSATVAGVHVALPAAPAPVVAPGEAIGRYVVESCIAGGGMGVVYRALDPELNRPVAIKLLQPEYASGDPEIARLRLLREAQALARISHRNVIAVYDVGRFRDSIFVAMELIDGRTMKDWLAEQPRTVREILRVFRDAAAALAATHHADLVHRDFKPTNVMVARDGRVCVLDFGLARDQHADSALTEHSGIARRESSPSLESSSDSLSGSGSSERLLSEQLTSAGQIVGTPAFMAPEQHRGEVVDAQADQFSFCASLYWALCGQLPFTVGAGKKRKLSAVKHAGEVQPIPSGVHLPRRVRRLLWRGLATLPAARAPSMDAVLRELDVVLRPKGPIIGAAAAAILLLGALAAGVHQRRTVGLCRGLDAEMRGVWSASARQSLRERLLGTGRANAGSTFDHVVRALDDYTASWTKMRVEACEATHVRGVQSPQLLDRRMTCLGRAKGQVAALVQLMSEQADGNMVDKAVGATLALPRLSSCADPAALSSAVPLPDDPAARASIDVLNTHMAAAAALRDTGRYRDGLQAARELTTQANTLGYAPTQASAELLLGTLEEEAGDFAAARAALSAAAKHAASAKDDALSVRVWNRLHKVIAVSQVNAKDAALVLPMAEAALLRIDRPALFEADLLQNEGAAALQAGDYVESEKIHRRALALVERTGAEGDSLLPSFLGSLAASIASQGRTEEARPLFERARVEDERIYGPDHPVVGKILTQLGLLYSRAEQYELSVATLQRARTILERTVGPDSPAVATVLVNLGSTYEAMNRIDDALPVERRAVEIWSRPGAENPDLCYALQGLANSLMSHSDFDEAWSVGERALSRFEATYGADHVDTSYAQELLGELLYRRGHLRDAEERYRRVFEIRQKGSGDPLEVAQILARIAEVQLHRGQLASAQTTLGEALARAGIAPSLLTVGGAGLPSGKQHILRRVLELRSELADAQHRPADALADAQRALTLEPESAGGLAAASLQLRVARLAHTDARPAMQAFERALTDLAPRNPNLPDALLDLAEAHLRASDRVGALQLLDRAAALPALLQGAAEDRARAYLLLAEVHADQPARAHTLARQAQAIYADAEPGVALDERRALARIVADGR